MEIDWQEVLCRALDGDAEALGAVCQEYLTPKVLTYTLTQLGHWHDAEDVTQQVFEKVIRNASRIRQRSLASFEAFVITVARNACIEFWRKRGRQNRLQSSESDAPGGDETPYQHVERQELKRILDQAIRENLSEEERQILVMHVFLEYSFRKIAEQTGISVSAVHTRYHQALQKMGKIPDVAAYSKGRRRNPK